MSKVDFFEQCELFLKEFASFRHLSDPRIYYTRALMSYHQGKVVESQELLNLAKSHGLDSDTTTKVRLRDFQDVLQNVESTEKASNVAKISIVETTTIEESKEEPNLVEQLKCHICGKPFKKAFTLNRHLLIHSGEKTHSCSSCGRSFAQKNDLIHHQLLHEATYDVKCTHQGCSKQFKSLKNMKRHLQTHQSQEVHQCDICAKAFRTVRYLRAHLAIHQSNQVLKCKICEKEFTTPRLLKSHMACHGSAKFPCLHCDKTFKRKSDLNYHCRVVHVIIPDLQ